MILVTGASQGIGLECARTLLARTESAVMITGRSAERLAAARASVAPAWRDRLLTRVSDQSSPADVQALAADLAADVTLEGAILTVGMNPAFADGPRRLHQVAPAMIEETVRTNCTHLLLLTTAVLRRLWARRGGSIVWIGSQAPAVGLPGAAVYCATKSFLSGLARAVHHEYAGRGIRAHVLHPALVRTPRTAAVVDRFAERHGLPVSAAADVAAAVADCYLGEIETPVEQAL